MILKMSPPRKSRSPRSTRSRFRTGYERQHAKPRIETEADVRVVGYNTPGRDIRAFAEPFGQWRRRRDHNVRKSVHEGWRVAGG